MQAQPLTAGRSIPRFIRDRRWWLLPLLLWAVGVTAYVSNHLVQLRAHTTEVALEGARNMFRMVVLTRNWNASHGGVYVPVTPRIQPNPYLDHPRRDITTTDGMALTMVNPAYMTRLIGEMIESDSGAVFRLTSLNPLRPANLPDAWEAKVLSSFDRGQKEAFSIEQRGGQTLLRYMAPLYVKESCLQCHEKQGYQLDDVRGGISVSQPYAPIARVVRAQAFEVGPIALATFLLFSALGWLLLEQLRRRWFELAEHARRLEDTQGQLLQSEKLASIGQLAAGVAHEINNPIGYVNSNLGTLDSYCKQLLELLERARRGQATQADFDAADFDYLQQDIGELLHESRGGIDRVRKIVADLKDFSRIDQAEWTDADLNAGIESTLNVVWNELKYKADVVREYTALPPVPCILAQINQVVMNLLVNAAHAIDQHGTITLRTGADPGFAWIEIEDTGKGMTPEVMQHIFEPFYTTKAVGKGTGLGLSVSYDIVRKHGGRIDVSSTPGKGSVFRVWLPLHPRAQVALHAQASSPASE